MMFSISFFIWTCLIDLDICEALQHSPPNFLCKNCRVVNTRRCCMVDEFHSIAAGINFNKDSAAKTIATISLVSAPLGTFLDNQHGMFNVLNYFQWQMDLTIGPLSDGSNWIILKSAYWVPFLFSFAGFAMTAIILVSDSFFKTSEKIRLPSWPTVLYCISLFSGQYYLSGALDYLGVDPLTINIILTFVAVVGFLVFDGSIAGLILALSTAIAGPVAEIGIINLTHVYSYTHADTYGICSWIPAVYFLGGPAVGNLARRVYSDFNQSNNSNCC